ncbi:hypothetical protein AKJ16_DCAP14487 [Drosera capensis]
MEQLDLEEQCIINTSLPYDLSLKIASSLQVRDVCALGCCSRFWKELCGSDPIWVSLYRQRWPLLDASSDNFTVPDGAKTSDSDTLLMDWRSLYIWWHNQMESRISFVIKSVEQSSLNNSLEVGNYLRAINELCAMQIGFGDVELFLFRPELHVFLNLIGLQYCENQLGIPVEYVLAALENNKISEKRVYVKWWKVGRWSFGFRLRDESHSRSVSLKDLAVGKDEDVLRVLKRGAVYEVIRVHISISNDLHPSIYLRSQQTA